MASINRRLDQRPSLTLLITSPKRKKPLISATQVRHNRPMRAAALGGNYSDGSSATSTSNNRAVYFDA